MSAKVCSIGSRERCAAREKKAVSRGPRTARELCAARRASSVPEGDLDADGVLDLVTANVSSHTTSTLRGTGGREYGMARTALAGVSPWGLAVGDFDLDGKVDAAVCNDEQTGFSLLRNVSQ
jgi:hypothetical protein